MPRAVFQAMDGVWQFYNGSFSGIGPIPVVTYSLYGVSSDRTVRYCGGHPGKQG